MKRFKRTILTVLVLTLMLSSFVSAGPLENMTRVGFVKEILKVMEVEITPVSSSPFADITNQADIPYLSAAFNKKIVTGSGGAFNPEAPVTKEQALIMLVRALGVINIDQEEISKTEIKFNDANKISKWAKPYVAYAVQYGLIENSDNNLNPQGTVNSLQAEQMMMNLKEASLREGLTAVQILQLADDKLKEYDTYKFKGSMDMRTTVKLPTGEEQVVLGKSFQEGTYEAPETVYTISKTITEVEGQLLEIISEVYMHDRVMYIRSGENQEWIKMDINPLMAQMESLMGSGQQGLPQMSKQELEAIGMYARYSKDIEVDGQEYYVIKVDLDAEAFMEMYNVILEEMFNTMFEGEMWEEMKKEQGVPATMDEETFKAMLKSTLEQVLQNMEIEMMQEYYIRKEDKIYDKLKIKQIISMSLMGAETKLNMDGEYEYYGFGEEVVFPQVQ